MGKAMNLHYSIKDQEDWSDRDWKMFFKDERFNEEKARQQPIMNKRKINKMEPKRFTGRLL